MSKTTKKNRDLARAAMIAALYVILTHLQNLIFPGSATWAIQCRMAEALCVLAYFTPAAIPGLSIGCLIFNLSFAGSLPLDMVVGTLATLLATLCMYKLRSHYVLGLFMPALFNAILVGWELTVYIGNPFLLNALFVALGELIVLLTLGSGLYWLIRKRHLEQKLFG